MINSDPLAVTDEEMAKFAGLYWDTWINFPKFGSSNQPASTYFLERLQKWFSESRDASILKNPLVSKAVSVIFEESRVLETGESIEMGNFFSNFGFTDIVIVGDTPYIWNAEIVPKPQGVGMAANMWTTLVHGSLEAPIDKLKDLQRRWTIAFMEEGWECRHYCNHDQTYKAIRANLLERLIATLLIDIPNRRSPYDKASDNEVATAKSKILSLLQFTLNHF